MQLDGFIRSAQRYAPYRRFAISVLWTGDDESYAICRSEHPEIHWMRQYDFEATTRRWIEQGGRIVFHTDDDLFFASPPPELLEEDAVVSFRLGRNTTFCHPLQTAQRVPEAFPWRWRDAEHDFAYPLSLNGTVFDASTIIPLLDFHFTNPTELEAQLAANAALFRVEWMTAPARSCVVSLPHNRVTSGSNNPISDVYAADYLREMYLEGYRIDLGALDYSLVDAAHVELPLHFYRVDTRRVPL